MQSTNDLQAKIINPCHLQTDEERQLLHNFLLSRKDQPYIPAGNHEFNGTKFKLKNSLLLRTRRVFGLSQPQIKFDVLSENPFDKGAFSYIHNILKSITLGRHSLRIKDDGKHIVKLTFENSQVTNNNRLPTNLKDIQTERNILKKGNKFNPKELQRYIDENNNNLITNFLTMRRIKGAPLKDLIALGLSIDQRLKLSILLLRALKEQAHDLGLIHRDIKPENIIVDLKTMEITILDFGFSIERNHQDKQVLGSPRYVSPEIIRKEDITEKSDIFSMGRVLSELWGDPDDTDGMPLHMQANYISKTTFTLDNLFQNKTDQFSDDKISPDSKNIIKHTLINMLSQDPQKRRSTETLMTSFHQALFDHNHPNFKTTNPISTKLHIVHNLSDDFNNGMHARNVLIHEHKYKIFLQNLKDHLEHIEDTEISIEAFTQGLGVHCLQAAKSKKDIFNKIDATINSFNTIANKYIDLFDKAYDLLTKYDVISGSEIFSELHEFIYEMNEKIERIKRKPCDLDLIVKTTKSLNHSYQSWQDRLVAVENDFRKNDHFQRIAPMIEATLKSDKPERIDISIPHEQEKLRLDLESLQNGLRAAIRKYMDSTLSDNNLLNRKRAASDRRVKDMDDLIDIINNAKNAKTLRQDTKNRMKKIETGFFGGNLFGGSKLRDNLNKALKIHKHKTSRYT